MDVLAALAVAILTSFAGWLVWYGATGVKIAAIEKRVDVIEQTQRDGLIPRQEFERAHEDICNWLTRIERKLDRIGGKTE